VRASAAQDHGSADFFAGFSLNQLSSIANSGSSMLSTMNFSGRVALNLTPGLQAVGEVGRIGNVLPPVTDALFSFSPFDVRASAFYGEGGVRAFAAPRSAVNPYVEATAGMARIGLTVGGISPTASDYFNLGPAFVNRTSPLAGIGGGVMFHPGPVVIDLGYRYKKIFARDLVDTLLVGGDSLRSHQVALGVGVRF
jgi:hypothetical protein